MTLLTEAGCPCRYNDKESKRNQLQSFGTEACQVIVEIQRCSSRRVTINRVHYLSAITKKNCLPNN